MDRVRGVFAISFVIAIIVAGCGLGESGDSKEEFIFAGSVRPRNFDPIFNDDGDTFRILSQMYETLVTHRPGTAQLAPGLAEDWDFLENGRALSFQLRRNVRFHDGTPFDASAVCYNFDRWFAMSNDATQSNMYYYGYVFGGFAENKIAGLGDPLYSSCEVKNEYAAILRLNRNTGALPAALTLPAFAISSPAALRKYNADTVTPEGSDSFQFSEYAMAHPTGTGPFELERHDSRSGTVTLRRFAEYWGESSQLDRVVFRVIGDKKQSKKELLSGEIDGYDFPSYSDYDALERAGCQVLVRPAFNVLYLGINQANTGKLRDIRVRRAIALSINRNRMVERLFPKGASVATQFIPDSVEGYARDVANYGYDPEKARKLLETANAENLTLRFYYPTAADRPYMPDPKEIYAAVASDLEAVGIRVEGVPEEWETYLSSVREQGEHDLHLLGWTGDYNDPGNFIGSFFGMRKAEFGYDDAEMFASVAAADAEPAPAAHVAAYEQLNRDLMDRWLPAIPLVHSPPAIAVGKDIRGLFASPITDERFVSVYRKE